MGVGRGVGVGGGVDVVSSVESPKPGSTLVTTWPPPWAGPWFDGLGVVVGAVSESADEGVSSEEVEVGDGSGSVVVGSAWATGGESWEVAAAAARESSEEEEAMAARNCTPGTELVALGSAEDESVEFELLSWRGSRPLGAAATPGPVAIGLLRASTPNSRTDSFILMSQTRVASNDRMVRCSDVVVFENATAKGGSRLQEDGRGEQEKREEEKKRRGGLRERNA